VRFRSKQYQRMKDLFTLNSIEERLVDENKERYEASLETELSAAGKGRLRHLGELDEAVLRSRIERHLRFTGSTRALAMLDHWDAMRSRFVKVFPNEYKRALGEMHVVQAAAKAAGATKRKQVA